MAKPKGMLASGRLNATWIDLIPILLSFTEVIAEFNGATPYVHWRNWGETRAPWACKSGLEILWEKFMLPVNCKKPHELPLSQYFVFMFPVLSGPQSLEAFESII